ncbi:unnamed protein product [Lota lota]
MVSTRSDPVRPRVLSGPGARRRGRGRGERVRAGRRRARGRVWLAEASGPSGSRPTSNGPFVVRISSCCADWLLEKGVCL